MEDENSQSVYIEGWAMDRLISIDETLKEILAKFDNPFQGSETQSERLNRELREWPS